MNDLEQKDPPTSVAPPLVADSLAPPVDATGPGLEPEKKSKKRKTVEVAVRLSKVTKKFGMKVAVEDVSLKVKAGSVYGLIGPNGAGKTTTFSMLAGYLQPTSGEVEMLGFPPSAVDQLRGRLGVLPQDALLPANDKVGQFLVHMARLQNMPKEDAEKAARTALDEVDGKEWWAQRCGSLSHGMAKRVALAQALLGEPEIVLLDEPTAGLDPRVAYEVRQIIKRRKGRCAMIVSSHNLQELEEICDAAAVLDRGHLVAAGSITELTAASAEVRIRIARAQPGPLPFPPLRELPMVKRVEFDEDRRDLVVHFERGPQVDAESVIAAVLWVLLNHRVRISGVTKGRGLEQRVMELTDSHDED